MTAVTAAPAPPTRSIGPRLGREAMRARFQPRPSCFDLAGSDLRSADGDPVGHGRPAGDR